MAWRPRPSETISPYKYIKVPALGSKITVNADTSLNVPDQPTIPYIEGDATERDITPVMLKVVDAAVARRNPARGAGLCGVDQGAAVDAGRWRCPFVERGFAPGTRPLCLLAAD